MISRITLLAAALLLISRGAAQTTAPEGAPPPTSTDAAAAVGEETNVGATGLGAKALEVAGTATGLDQVLAGTEGAQAELKPGPSGSAATVIDLSGQADLSRVALEVGKAKGRLVIMALNEDGQLVDLSTPEGAKNLIGDKTLDGTESTISIDVSQLKAKSVMIYWVPAEPGESLPLTKVGIFTRQAVVPDAAGMAIAVPPAPVVPSPQLIQSAREAYFAAGSSAPTPTPTTTTTTTTLPETIPPSSRAISL